MSEEDIRVAAQELLAASFEVLAEQDVIPRPRWDAYMRVGRDYWGPDFMGLPAFRKFEQVLSSNYPYRFDERIRPYDEYQEFPNSFAFHLIEAAVARLTSRGEDFNVSSLTVEMCIDELIQSLAEEDFEVACVWVVTHMTTTDGQPVSVGDITITPEQSRLDLERRIAEVIPSARALLGSETPFVHDPPLSVIEALSSGPHPCNELSSLRSKLDTFLLLVRLVFASTAQAAYEVAGSTSLQRSVTAYSTSFRGARSLIRRTVRIGAEYGDVLSAVKSLLDSVWTDQPDMAVTSLSMAFRKFSASFLNEPWFEQIVDLSTALEAVLSGTDKEDISLRLRTRAAALLATPNDPPRSIFEDVGLLYGMRSTLVHGGNLAMAKVKKDISKLSTVKEELREAIRVAQAVDRLQDLVRRAILARICLAGGDQPLWPLGGSTNVDAALADDTERARWRSSWTQQLQEVGVSGAGDRARPAVDFLFDDPS
jgi:hypothetical protein